MPPDLNSLPASSTPPTNTPLQARGPPTEQQSRTMSQSPSHTPPHSLAAAATMNAGIHNEDLRRQSSGTMRREVERARRRSSIRMNLNFNDPAIPAPGEMQTSPSSRGLGAPWPHSPHHERAPSLGDLHQELEYEQEGQVNRLLTMIRQQQSQIQTLQTQPHPHASSAVDDSTPTSERSMSIPPLPPPQPTLHNPRVDMSRQSSFASRSRNSSQAVSPALRPTSSHGFSAYESTESLPPSTYSTRDESAFYQAETQNLTRENQMLKQRIRELERQLSEANPVTHSPATASNLHSSPPVSRQHAGVI
ncbi:hypothetical protein P171DRAFT_451428 [Karstenula rhodostoma CBS 690.94]|uniref:Uncharacterized protein n=1 Tax=Karstenula rhodostoma CBS 690.94 TaxID=1392251 RepID=A0A9P4UJA5_9PLEO|nr:hypothetical protein P171DRAFT_451428 [Karstenula rhodostoma CBS 690.94]